MLLGRRLVRFGHWHHERRALSVWDFGAISPPQQLARDAQRTKKRLHLRPPLRCVPLWGRQQRWRRTQWQRTAIRRSCSSWRGIRIWSCMKATEDVISKTGWVEVLLLRRMDYCPEHLVFVCSFFGTCLKCAPIRMFVGSFFLIMFTCGENRYVKLLVALFPSPLKSWTSGRCQQLLPTAKTAATVAAAAGGTT